MLAGPKRLTRSLPSNADGHAHQHTPALESPHEAIAA
jgi:hypothetical protein